MNIFIKKKRQYYDYNIAEETTYCFFLIAKKQFPKNIVNNYTDRHFNRFTLLMTKRKNKSSELFSTSNQYKKKKQSKCSRFANTDI